MLDNLIGLRKNSTKTLTNLQHDQLWFDVIKLSVVQSPQKVLRSIAANTIVVGMSRSVILVPDFSAISSPSLSDGVSVEDDLHISGMLVGHVEQLLVSVLPPGVTPRLRLPGNACTDQANQGKCEGQLGVHFFLLMVQCRQRDVCSVVAWDCSRLYTALRCLIFNFCRCVLTMK